jgi:hypothetical protein
MIDSTQNELQHERNEVLLAIHYYFFIADKQISPGMYALSLATRSILSTDKIIPVRNH